MTRQARAARQAGLAELYEHVLGPMRLRLPEGIADVLDGPVGRELHGLVYWPGGDPGQANSLATGGRLLGDAVWAAPDNYLPLMPVDEESIACVVCVRSGEDDSVAEAKGGEVLRWHLGAIEERYQGALLDSDAALWLASVAEELAGRRPSLERIKSRAAIYHSAYLEKLSAGGGKGGERPRSFVQRPVQLACQNVIIGLAVLQQDSTFDGLRVRDYLTCEAPHLATHEANRAMAALILCDAFQCGGTMEIRFGPPDRRVPVPPALRRYGRAQGIDIGVEDHAAITPAEARRLFMAVTLMPDELRMRTATWFDRGLLSPERVCFTLMASIWSPLELDYLLATSTRALSILEGGAPAALRRARLAEAESCRAALMAGMLHRRVTARDGAGADSGVRVFEDARETAPWAVLEESGAVAIAMEPAQLPWRPPGRVSGAAQGAGYAVLLPRALPTPMDLDLLRACAADHPEAEALLLVPADMAELIPSDVPLLVCPDRLGELDAAIERKLGASRIGGE
jgi:hypothetical protein